MAAPCCYRSVFSKTSPLNAALNVPGLASLPLFLGIFIGGKRITSKSMTVVRHHPGVFFRLLKSSVCVSTSVFCAAFPVRMFVFAGRLLGLDRWPLSCWRVGGRPLGRRHAVGASGCGARSARCFGLTVTCRRRGLPFHSREDGAQRALLKAGSAQRRSQRLKPGAWLRDPRSQPRRELCCC